MAPMRFLFTSALVVSAAIAAPINTNAVDSGEDGTAAATLPIKHQSEPMRQADPVMSSIPSGTVDVAAMKSSAAAAAAAEAATPSGSGDDDDIFNVLKKLPRGYEWVRTRRQLDQVTELLTELNQVGKRGDVETEKLETRQLGLVKSVPEAAGQLPQVLNLAESLPIKRDGDGNILDLLGLGLQRRSEIPGLEASDGHEDSKKKPTYTEQALKGFLHKHDPAQDDAKEAQEAAESLGLDVPKGGESPTKRQSLDSVTGTVTGLLGGIKRDVEASDAEAADAKKKPTYTEQALKGFLHKHEPAQDDAKEAQEAAESLGLDVPKRAEATDEKTKPTYTEKALKGFLHKHEPAQDDKKEAAEAAQELGLNVAKRAEEADAKKKPTYTEQALKGFLHKHEPAQDDAKEAQEAAAALGVDDLGGLTKRSEEEADADAKKKPTYTEQALKGFLHKHEPAQDDKKEAAEAAQSLGLDVAKRAEAGEERKKTYTEQALKGFLHKHEPAQDDAKEAQEAAESLGVDGLGGLTKRTEEADTKKEKPTYTEQALKGFLHKHEPAQDDKKEAAEAAQELGLDVAKRSQATDATDATDAKKKPTYTEQALKGFFHNAPAQDDAKEAQQAAQSLGVLKRAAGDDGDGDDDISEISDDLDALTALEAMLDNFDKRQVSDPLGLLDAVSSLGLIGKRGGGGDPLGIIDEVLSLPDDLLGVLRARGEGDNLSKRQLNIVSALATSGLSNAGSAAGELAKVVSGKMMHRRADGGAEATTEAAMASLVGMGMGQHKQEKTTSDDIAEQFQDAKEAGSELPSHSLGEGSSLAKRQVPPIAGSDLLSVAKGLVADPSKALKPVTEGILVGGNSLEDLSKPQ